MSSLTMRQREILEHILDFLENHGRAPSGPEIAEAFDVHHSTAYEHLRKLADKNYLEVNQPSARGMLRVRPTPLARRLHAPGLPLLGSIPAGPVTDIGEEGDVERIESVQDLFPMMKPDDFLLTVDGDSMITAGLREGMLLLMRPGLEPKNGQICAVWVDGDGGTLKRVYNEGPMIRLQPSNPDYDAVRVPSERVRVQGVLVASLAIEHHGPR